MADTAAISPITARLRDLSDRVSSDVLVDAARDELARVHTACDRLERLIAALQLKLEDASK